MAEMGFPADHTCQLRHNLYLHGRTSATAVQCMIVGIQHEAECIGESSDGMWRLQHLSRVERVMIRVVVAEPASHIEEQLAELRPSLVFVTPGYLRQTGFELARRIGQHPQFSFCVHAGLVIPRVAG